MATPYSGNPGNYPTSAALPDDGDKPTAELFNVPYEALMDRTANLKAITDEHESDVTALASRMSLAESDILDIEAKLVPTVEEFTGSGTYNKPADAVRVDVLCVGGGGGGGGADFSDNGGGGGGAGEVVQSSFAAALVGSSVAVTVGARGTGGGVGANGVDGSNTTFGALLLARGGKGGSGTTSAAGEGGNAIAFKGGAGGTGNSNGEDGEGPTGVAGTGGVDDGTRALSGKGYGAGGGGGQNNPGAGGGGGGAAGYSDTGSRVAATSTAGTLGKSGYCLVTTWRTA